MSNQHLLMASAKPGSSGSGSSGPTDSNFNYVAALLHGNGIECLVSHRGYS